MTRKRGRGESLYRLLLLAYPRPFREEYEDVLLELFQYRRDQRLRAAGRLGGGFWSYIGRDVAASAWRERRHPLPARGAHERHTPSRGDGMKGWIDDFAYAGRRLARSPGFSLAALTILVLTIGANSTAFSVVNALLLQPPPFAQPERVVTILQDSDAGLPNSTSYPAYLAITHVEGVFESVSAYYQNQALLEQDDVLTPILVEYATASFMDVVGLSPSRGTWFDAAADDPSGPPAAVITHKMWTGRLGSDPDVLGSIIRVGGGAVTVVGIGPASFNGGIGLAAVDLWLSISALRPTGGNFATLTRRQDHWFTVRARLTPEASLIQASAAMDRLGEDLARSYPELNADRGITVLSVLTNRISPQADRSMMLGSVFAMAVVILVLLIGTLNLANLLLVRTTTRARELAVRLALGAGRARVVRVVVTEAVLLAAVGGAGGLAMAYGVTAALRNSRFDFGLPLSIDIRLDGGVLLFTLTISAVTGLVFGLLPALRATRRDVSASLRDDAVTMIGARRRFGLTGVLVASQVAASLLLLAVAGLFLESLSSAEGADPGFAYENTAYVQLGMAPLGLESDEATLLYGRLEARLEALPGVGGVTESARLPGAMFGSTTLLLGAGVGGVDRPTEISWNYIAPDYFQVMGVPVLHGRAFEDADLTGPDASIVSAAFARTYWGRSDVVGENYRSEADPDVRREIIGVVGDVTVRALGEPPTPSIYWPLNVSLRSPNFIFEAEGSMPEALGAVRAAVSDFDSRIMILQASSMRDHLGATLGIQRVVGTLLGLLGGLALLLAVLGIYGVVSFTASRRRHEVGIRMALGAGREAVVRLLVRDVSMVVLVGAAVGLALSIPVGRVVGLLFTGAGGSLASTGAVAALMLVTALVATVIPALGAARTDPANALRRE